MKGGDWEPLDFSCKLLFRCPDSLSLSLIRHRLTFLPPVAPWRAWQAGGLSVDVSMATDHLVAAAAAALFAGNASAASAPPPLTYSWKSGEATKSFSHNSESETESESLL